MRRSPARFHAAGWSMLFVALALTLITATVFGSGRKKRDPSIAIRFHAQVLAFDPTFAVKVQVGTPPREIVIEKLPSISEHDIASFYPYRASDGSYSAVLQLERHGAATLENISAQKLGMVLVVAVNGHAITTLKVDKVINDGVLFIPFGLTETDIRSMGASFNLMGDTRADYETRHQEPTPAPGLDNGALPIPTPPKKR